MMVAVLGWLVMGLVLAQGSHFHKVNVEKHCRMVERELSIPAEQKHFNVRDDTNLGEWYGTHWEANWSCPYEERVMLVRNATKTAGDGGKWVCMSQLADKPTCLVYSIGSNGDFSFESGFLDLVNMNCEVHVFDMGTFSNKGFPQKHFDAIHKHAWGIGHSDTSAKGIEMKTLASTIKSLGHSGRTISVLKIDVEGWEFGMLDRAVFWKSLRDLNVKVDQLLLETHFAHPVLSGKGYQYRSGAEMDYLLRNITQQGFAMFHKEINYLWQRGCEFAFMHVNAQCGGTGSAALPLTVPK